jgi:hypothetical protein
MGAGQGDVHAVITKENGAQWLSTKKPRRFLEGRGFSEVVAGGGFEPPTFGL